VTNDGTLFSWLCSWSRINPQWMSVCYMLLWLQRSPPNLYIALSYNVVQWGLSVPAWRVSAWSEQPWWEQGTASCSGDVVKKLGDGLVEATVYVPWLALRSNTMAISEMLCAAPPNCNTTINVLHTLFTPTAWFWKWMACHTSLCTPTKYGFQVSYFALRFCL
jgi:hypothetical protein